MATKELHDYVLNGGEVFKILSIFQVEENIIRINKTYDYNISTGSITAVDGHKAIKMVQEEYIKWSFRNYIETLDDVLNPKTPWFSPPVCIQYEDTL